MNFNINCCGPTGQIRGSSTKNMYNRNPILTNCPVCEQPLVENINDFVIKKCSLNIKHFQLLRHPKGVLYVRKYKYLLMYKVNKTLEIWKYISSNFQKYMYSLSCDSKDFCKICELQELPFNEKIRLLTVLS